MEQRCSRRSCQPCRPWFARARHGRALEEAYAQAVESGEILKAVANEELGHGCVTDKTTPSGVSHTMAISTHAHHGYLPLQVPPLPPERRGCIATVGTTCEVTILMREPAVARTQGGHQEAEVRAHHGPQDEHLHRAAVQRIPM